MAPNRRRALREAYAKVPGIECKGLCADACGPIEMSNLERSIIRKRGVEITDRQEALEELHRTGDFDCDALVDGRCSVYDDRPMVCRVWGVTEALQCPYGCTAEAVLPDAEAFVLMAEVLHIGGAEYDVPVPTREALLAAWEKPDTQAVLGPMLKAMRPKDSRPSSDRSTPVPPA